MSQNKETIQALIEAYLEGELSDEEKLDFEQRLKTDQALAKQWQLNQEIDKALQNPMALKMESILKNAGDEYVAKNYSDNKSTIRKARLSPLRILSIAASVALLLGLLWWQFGSSETLNPQELYARNYQPYISAATIRSDNPNLQNEFQKAQEIYQSADYSAAQQSFEALLTDSAITEDDKAASQFYLGLSHLGLKNFKAAESHLKLVLQNTGSSYTQMCQWYLALIALHDNDVPAAKDWLDQVIETSPNGKFATQASRLLKQL